MYPHVVRADRDRLGDRSGGRRRPRRVAGDQQSRRDQHTDQQERLEAHTEPQPPQVRASVDDGSGRGPGGCVDRYHRVDRLPYPGPRPRRGEERQPDDPELDHQHVPVVGVEQDVPRPHLAQRLVDRRSRSTRHRAGRQGREAQHRWRGLLMFLPPARTALSSSTSPPSQMLIAPDVRGVAGDRDRSMSTRGGMSAQRERHPDADQEHAPARRAAPAGQVVAVGQQQARGRRSAGVARRAPVRKSWPGPAAGAARRSCRRDRCPRRTGP